LSDNFCSQIGGLAELTNKRPSEFFDWNGADEWEERLIFDTYVMGIYTKVRSG